MIRLTLITLLISLTLTCHAYETSSKIITTEKGQTTIPCPNGYFFLPDIPESEINVDNYDTSEHYDYVLSRIVDIKINPDNYDSIKLLLVGVSTTKEISQSEFDIQKASIKERIKSSISRQKNKSTDERSDEINITEYTPFAETDNCLCYSRHITYKQAPAQQKENEFTSTAFIMLPDSILFVRFVTYNPRESNQQELLNYIKTVFDANEVTTKTTNKISESSGLKNTETFHQPATADQHNIDYSFEYPSSWELRTNQTNENTLMIANNSQSCNPVLTFIVEDYKLPLPQDEITNFNKIEQRRIAATILYDKMAKGDNDNYKSLSKKSTLTKHGRYPLLTIEECAILDFKAEQDIYSHSKSYYLIIDSRLLLFLLSVHQYNLPEVIEEADRVFNEALPEVDQFFKNVKINSY